MSNVKTNAMKRKSLYVMAIGICLVFFTVSMNWRGSESTAKHEVSEETVVVSTHSDPYFGLAEQIAQEENLRIFETFTDTLPFHPRFVILVASPKNLTIERLSSIANTFKSQAYYRPWVLLAALPWMRRNGFGQEEIRSVPAIILWVAMSISTSLYMNPPYSILVMAPRQKFPWMKIR